MERTLSEFGTRFANLEPLVFAARKSAQHPPWHYAAHLAG